MNRRQALTVGLQAAIGGLGSSVASGRTATQLSEADRIAILGGNAARFLPLAG